MADSATWVCFMNDEIEALKRVLDDATMWQNVRDGASPDADAISKRLAIFMAPDSKDQRYRDAAENLNFVRDGECEIDSNAVVSKGGDPGAYVMAWVWVYDDDAGIEPEEDADAPGD